jgi:type IV pilus assembly protein PilO
MAALTQQRRRFTFALVAMGIICLLAALFLVAPITASSAQRFDELRVKQDQLRAREKETRPIRNLSQLIDKAKIDYNRFSSERLTAFPSTVYTDIYELARKNNVSLGEMKYDSYDTETPALKLLQVQARVSGQYPNLVRFINAIERDKLFFVIRTLQLTDTRADRGEQSVQLTLTMETYLRPRQPNEKPSVSSKQAPADEEDSE